jgi:hypothetical protein
VGVRAGSGGNLRLGTGGFGSGVAGNDGGVVWGEETFLTEQVCW